jgi:dsRNA-specific ribonuclease
MYVILFFRNVGRSKAHYTVWTTNGLSSFQLTCILALLLRCAFRHYRRYQMNSMQCTLIRRKSLKCLSRIIYKLMRKRLLKPFERSRFVQHKHKARNIRQYEAFRKYLDCSNSSELRCHNYVYQNIFQIKGKHFGNKIVFAMRFEILFAAIWCYYFLLGSWSQRVHLKRWIISVRKQ